MNPEIFLSSLSGQSVLLRSYYSPVPNAQYAYGLIPVRRVGNAHWRGKSLTLHACSIPRVMSSRLMHRCC